jgi:peptidoglycan/LPS O-acetylase OafA/YrhL
MQTFASRHVPELDGLRGIAIITVLIHHQLTPFSLNAGFLGVDLFFVLSGFLITGLLLAEFEGTKTISLRNFYMRRVLRLGPALALYLIGCLAVTHYTQAISLTRQLKLIGIALIYSTNWRMAFGWDDVLDPTAIIWSLSIEEQFYLVWPLVLFGLFSLNVRRRYIAATLAIVITAILIHRFSLLNAGHELTRLYYGTDTRADALLMGCLFALVPLRLDARLARTSLMIASVLSVVCLTYLIGSAEFTDRFLYAGGFTIVALAAGIVILAASTSQPPVLSAFFQWGPLRWFGHISYGLYLWHWLVVRNTSFYYLGRAEPWAKLLVAVGIASASFYLVEKPFNKLKKRFATRPTEKSAVTVLSHSPTAPIVDCAKA